ncbi:alternative ribosome rescue aminoacyl-tRNA hydrolase ArfB [Candidatus Albibeggiatoa sp. nov. BB20]|uniref:alternative ribosome rescue aminoacyl-tRNA hydrolase ArfB n=1 Tax=Candidatus Albibeggiatoa sp. nov. BB20 TaxID=3162723 RepID=UPI0033655DE3
MIKITNTLFIDEKELEEKFIRSPGAGGQNVNKVSTGVQLRFDAKKCGMISEAMFNRLRNIASHLMTQDGIIQVIATQFRTQERNRLDARERLADLIKQATVEPKHRRPTKPSWSAKTKRTDQKKQRGKTKKNRSKVSRSDY